MKELKKLGLTDNEIEVYVTIVKNGAISVRDIYKSTLVKRTTIYTCLEKLVKQGLVSFGKKHGKTIYSAEHPERLLENAEKQHNSVKDLVTKLKNISNTSKVVPEVKVFEGKDAFWNISEDFLKSKQNLYSLLSAKNQFENIDQAEFNKRVTKRRRQIGAAKSFYITDQHPAAIREFKRGEIDFSEYRFLPEDTNLHGAVGVYGDTVAFYNSKEPFWGVIIKNKEIAEVVKYMWDIVWKVRSESDLRLIKSPQNDPQNRTSPDPHGT